MAEEEKQEQQVPDPFNIDLSALNMEAAMVVPPEEKQVEEEKQEIKPEVHLEEQQEEVKQEESESEENKEASLSQDTKDSSPFIPFAKLMVERGVTPNLNVDEYDGEPEGIIKAMQDEIQNGINLYKETSLHPRIKHLQDNYEEGVPLKALLEIDEQRTTLDGLTEESIAESDVLQKDIAKQYFTETTSFSESEITKAIERLEATGDLAEETKGYFGKLKDINVQKEQDLKVQAQQQQELLRTQQEQTLANFKSTLESTEEVIPGIKVTPIMRDKVFKTLTTTVDVDKETGMPLNEIAVARSKDPVNFELKFSYIWNLTKGFTDWSSLGTVGKSTAMKELEDSLKKQDRTQTKQSIQKPNTDSDLVKQMEFIGNMARQQNY